MATDQKYITPRVPHETPMYDADGKMTRTWIIFLERLGLWETTNRIVNPAAGEKKATFGLVKSLTVDVDLTNHYIARTGGVFSKWVANAKIAPTGTIATLDIKISSDEGVSWNSIFNAGAGMQIDLPIGATDLLEGEVFNLNPAYNRIQENNLLRIDCTQIGSVVPGKDIEVVLQWE